jgi:hypothetical protein
MKIMDKLKLEGDNLKVNLITGNDLENPVNNGSVQRVNGMSSIRPEHMYRMQVLRNMIWEQLSYRTKKRRENKTEKRLMDCK